MTTENPRATPHLEPCPFCGGEAKVLTVGNMLPNGTIDELFRVQCQVRECGHEGMPWYPASSAVAAWNRRTTRSESGRFSPLEKFAISLLEDMREHPGDDMDGGHLQHQAEHYGLIHSVPVTEACYADCACAEVGFPADCMRETDYLRPLLARFRKENL